MILLCVTSDQCVHCHLLRSDWSPEAIFRPHPQLNSLINIHFVNQYQDAEMVSYNCNSSSLSGSLPRSIQVMLLRGVRMFPCWLVVSKIDWERALVTHSPFLLWNCIFRVDTQAPFLTRITFDDSTILVPPSSSLPINQSTTVTPEAIQRTIALLQSHLDTITQAAAPRMIIRFIDPNDDHLPFEVWTSREDDLRRF